MSSLLERDNDLGVSSDPGTSEFRTGEEVSIIGRSQLARLPIWHRAFSHLRKDRRYYEIVEDTICPEFQYRYFGIRDRRGKLCAIQPFFILDQDLLTGVGPGLKTLVDRVRRFWPRFLVMKSLMVGCAAGEGHLPSAEAGANGRDAALLSGSILRLARQEKASLVVLKEFPAQYRTALSCFLQRGFTRIPSMPMTRLNIAYESFDDYMRKALKSSTRKKLRKKFEAAEESVPIELEVATDVSSSIDEIYRLYVQVFRRSKLHFEKLTKFYFRELGLRMPDKVRFFLWRQQGKLVAFAVCLTEDDTLYGEYIGLDYTVALDLHLYHRVMRDVMAWGIENGFKSFVSSGLNYEPKLQMRHVLEPLDLYVRHTSSLLNAILRRVLPWIEPTRRDKTLPKFPNYAELWAEPQQAATLRAPVASASRPRRAFRLPFRASFAKPASAARYESARWWKKLSRRTSRPGRN
jgi:predicted N-acyltransferase